MKLLSLKSWLNDFLIFFRLWLKKILVTFSKDFELLRFGYSFLGVKRRTELSIFGLGLKELGLTSIIFFYIKFPI